MDYQTTIKYIKDHIDLLKIEYNPKDEDENKIEDYLVEKAQNLGFLCIKVNSSSSSGLPDRLLLGYGLTIFIKLAKNTRDFSHEMN